MELVSDRILAFMLAFTRVGAFFAVCPVFGWQTIPTSVKAVVAIFIGVFFAGINPCVLSSEGLSALELSLVVGTEAMYGLGLGYITIFIFSSVRLAARICERQMGLSMANILDPLSGENAQPVGMIMEIVFVLLFLSANGHHVLLLTMAKSYESFPIGAGPAVGTVLDSIMVSSSTMLLLGLKMSVPILAAFLLMMVVLAVLARIAPETNILFLSLPLKVGLGLIMIGSFVPFINEFVAQFAQWLDKLVPVS